MEPGTRVRATGTFSYLGTGTVTRYTKDELGYGYGTSGQVRVNWDNGNTQAREIHFSWLEKI